MLILAIRYVRTSSLTICSHGEYDAIWKEYLIFFGRLKFLGWLKFLGYAAISFNFADIFGIQIKLGKITSQIKTKRYHFKDF